MRALVLDDMDERHAVITPMLKREGYEVTEARSFDEAIAALRGEPFDEVWLDHDLDNSPPAYGNREMTGYDVANYIAEIPASRAPARVYIHSWNPDGAKAMATRLRAAGIPVIVTPFRDTWQ